MPRAKKPIADPFSINEVVNPKDKPEPTGFEKRFYYYYHRPTKKMSLRFGNDLYLVEGIDCIRLDTWIAMHGVPPLKYLVAGNATRVYIKNDKAVLS